MPRKISLYDENGNLRMPVIDPVGMQEMTFSAQRFDPALHTRNKRIVVPYAPPLEFRRDIAQVREGLRIEMVQVSASAIAFNPVQYAVVASTLTRCNEGPTLSGRVQELTQEVRDFGERIALCVKIVKGKIVAGLASASSMSTKALCGSPQDFL